MTRIRRTPTVSLGARPAIARAPRRRRAPDRARSGPRADERFPPPPRGFAWLADDIAQGAIDILAGGGDRPTVVVRANGTIGIPRGIRNALLLDPGERVSLGFEQGVLTVRPVEAWEASGASTGGASALDREIDDFLRRRRRRTPA